MRPAKNRGGRGLATRRLDKHAHYRPPTFPKTQALTTPQFAKDSKRHVHDDEIGDSPRLGFWLSLISPSKGHAYWCCDAALQFVVRRASPQRNDMVPKESFH